MYFEAVRESVALHSQSPGLAKVLFLHPHCKWMSSQQRLIWDRTGGQIRSHVRVDLKGVSGHRLCGTLWRCAPSLSLLSKAAHVRGAFHIFFSFLCLWCSQEALSCVCMCVHTCLHTYRWMCVCICTCRWMCVCVCICACRWMCVYDEGWSWVSSSVTCPLTFLDNLSLNLELADLVDYLTNRIQGSPVSVFTMLRL